MTNKDIIDMERRREKPDLFSIFMNRSISPFLYWAAGYISYVTHIHREREERKGSPVVSRKTLKEILNVTQAHTSHTQQEVRHTLLQSTQVSLPVDRVAASHVTPHCQFVSLCFLLLKRDLNIGPPRLKRKNVQDMLWLQ